MCGICGVVGEGDPAAERAVSAMNRALEHRGPEGTFLSRVGAAVFGHTRLAFVDLVSSWQPYRSPDSSVLLAFNGEIYNHALLRDELACDIPGEAALLAELFIRHGAAMVEKLDGMYAIAVYAAGEDALYLMRDPFGQKPLSYAVEGRIVRFASEARALRALPTVRSEIHPQALALYLTHNAVPPPHSLSGKICQVPAGSVLRIQDGTIHHLSEWQPKVSHEGWRASETEHPEAILELALKRAVRSHVACELPCGVFLSGGLDSSLIAAMVAEESGDRPPCFTAQFPDAGSFDESSWATSVGHSLKLPHRLVPLSLSDLGSLAERWLPAMDEPIADHSFLPTVAVAQAARQEVKAVLTGDGADELLMGYRLFEAMAIIGTITRFLPRPALRGLLSAWGRMRASEGNLDSRQIAARLALAVSAPPAYAYTLAGAAFRPEEWRRILSAEAFAAAGTVNAFDEIDRQLALLGTADDAEQLQSGMLTHFLRHVIIPKLDRATMLVGLEARSPFLSREFSEVALQVPRTEKLRGRSTKDVLRRIARRFLPESVVARKKQGFRAPIAALLRGPLRSFLCDHLREASLRRAGLLNPTEVQRLLNEHLNHGRDHHRALWSLLCFQCWASDLGGSNPSGYSNEEELAKP